jgi:hypothetical protein
LPVSQDGYRDKGKFERRQVPLGLGENDFVLVIFGKRYGMYIHVLYLDADETTFRDWVETGIIEPKRYANFGGDCPGTGFVLLAEIVGENAARISQAQKLLAELGDTEQNQGSREKLVNLISSFSQKVEHDIRASGISLSAIDSLITKVETTIRLLQEQKQEQSLMLEIDSNLEHHDEDKDFGRLKTLKGQVKATLENLKLHEVALANLKVMRNYLAKFEDTNSTARGGSGS